MKVLVVEDSERLRKSLAIGLKRAGYAVDVSADGVDGAWRAESGEYDVVVLDLMLPQLDGLSVLARLRKARSPSRVLVLTAKDALADRVTGLRAGADDYLVKPFAFEELLARVQALCRRGYAPATPLLEFGEVTIDLGRRIVTRAGVAVELSKREWMLLEFLAVKRGEFVSRSEIEAHIYDEGSEPMSNAVDVTVLRLRKKLDPQGGASLIRSQRGLGYRLDVGDA